MLILIRHPRVDLPPGLCYGRLDADIAATADIDAIVARIPKDGRITLWSSPSLRCARVADAIAEEVGLACCYDPRLRELDFGAWEGRAWSDIPRAELDRWAADPLGFAAPEGERGRDLLSRVSAFYNDLSAYDALRIVVSHGGPLRILGALAQCRAPDLLAPAPLLGSVQIIA